MPIAVIGCGAAGERHVSHLTASAAAEVRWVCDTDREAAARCGARHGVPRRATDFREILADKVVQAVVVATPPASHRKLTVAAIRAGKSVLVEKPAAITLTDARAILEAARERPELLVMDCSARHSRLHAKYHHVRREIASGGLGEVYCVHHRAVQRNARPGVEYQPGTRWFTRRSISGGGPLLDFGGYDLAFHLGVLGLRPPCVEAMIALTRGGLDAVSRDRFTFDVEEHGVVMMRLRGGIVYYWERATNAHADAGDVSRIYGTDGGLRFSYPSWLPGRVERFEPGVAEAHVIDLGSLAEQDAQEDHRRLVLHFVACLRGEERPVVPLEEAVENLAIVLAAYKRQGADRPVASPVPEGRGGGGLGPIRGVS